MRVPLLTKLPELQTQAESCPVSSFQRDNKFVSLWGLSCRSTLPETGGYDWQPVSLNLKSIGKPANAGAGGCTRAQLITNLEGVRYDTAKQPSE